MFLLFLPQRTVSVVLVQSETLTFTLTFSSYTPPLWAVERNCGKCRKSLSAVDEMNLVTQLTHISRRNIDTLRQGRWVELPETVCVCVCVCVLYYKQCDGHTHTHWVSGWSDGGRSILVQHLSLFVSPTFLPADWTAGCGNLATFRYLPAFQLSLVPADSQICWTTRWKNSVSVVWLTEACLMSHCEWDWTRRRSQRVHLSGGSLWLRVDYYTYNNQRKNIWIILEKNEIVIIMWKINLMTNNIKVSQTFVLKPQSLFSALHKNPEEETESHVIPSAQCKKCPKMNQTQNY